MNKDTKTPGVIEILDKIEQIWHTWAESSLAEKYDSFLLEHKIWRKQQKGIEREEHAQSNFDVCKTQ